ncbi:DUF4349 domain-containing protein [Candidatus Uhrbacteria bacterium]|nr:DUF4349 domain-containing protein [Candidatus Uhrbacteria bacterium]
MTRRRKIVVGILVVVAVIIAVPVALRVVVLLKERSAPSYADAYPPPPTSFRRSGSTGALSAPQLEFGMATGLAARPSLFGSLKRPAPPTPPSGAGADEIGTERLVIKSGVLSLVTRNVPNAVAQVTALVEESKGFVVESALDDLATSPRARMRVRIPADGLDTFMGKVREFGTRVVSESVRGEDVTEEYVDVQAQLRNLKASEAQFLEILREARTIADILNVQQQLERVRNEIERLEGRKKYLEQSATMSTVQLYLAAEEDALPTITPQQRWRPKAVWKASVRSLILTAQGLANLAIRLAVLAPIWVPIVLIMWFVWRRHRRRAAPKAVASN